LQVVCNGDGVQEGGVGTSGTSGLLGTSGTTGTTGSTGTSGSSGLSASVTYAEIPWDWLMGNTIYTVIYISNQLLQFFY
jgi:hypothetical protein